VVGDLAGRRPALQRSLVTVLFPLAFPSDQQGSAPIHRGGSLARILERTADLQNRTALPAAMTRCPDGPMIHGVNLHDR
jgi:hypothetical protein